MNLSFAGCGFLGIYHIGVAIGFKKYAPHLSLNKISGASAGAMAACCLLCDLPLVDTESLYIDGNQQNMENLSDASLEDETLDNANIFSDPESEWEMEKEQAVAPKSPDSRPEVDQPSTSLL